MPVWEDYAADEHITEAGQRRLKVLKELHSPELGNTRDILVYLPPSYESSTRRYPVIYMHDGQNLFDPKTSFAGAWEVDDTLDKASQEGVEAIVVGITNVGVERANEYSPFDDRRHGPGKGDAYLSFITDTIKPIIDADFRTEPAREQTGIAGSSMGGLISLYAFFRRPDAFGFAGVMSPALWFGRRRIFDYLERATHVPGKLYLDVGTQEGKEALNDVARLRDRLTTMGYRIGHDLLYVVDRGAGHNEAAWAKRLGKQLRFLLGRPAALPK
jgi:predicted alpha/beta superfamily hydrolase